MNRQDVIKILTSLNAVLIPLKGKAPSPSEWQKLRQSHPDALDPNANCNIGVVLGDPSAGIVDVDIDRMEALPLADYLSPANAKWFSGVNPSLEATGFTNARNPGGPCNGKTTVAWLSNYEGMVGRRCFRRRYIPPVNTSSSTRPELPQQSHGTNSKTRWSNSPSRLKSPHRTISAIATILHWR